MCTLGMRAGCKPDVIGAMCYQQCVDAAGPDAGRMMQNVAHSALSLQVDAVQVWTYID